jgi:hypothetical protein
MRKLGQIFILAIIILIGLAFYQDHLDKLVALRVNAVVADIVSNGWSVDAFESNASSSLLKRHDECVRLFALYWTLGRVKTIDDSVGKTYHFLGYLVGGQLQAEYLTKAEFDNGEATIKTLLLLSNGTWKIAGFWVNCPQLNSRLGNLPQSNMSDRSIPTPGNVLNPLESPYINPLDRPANQ